MHCKESKILHKKAERTLQGDFIMVNTILFAIAIFFLLGFFIAPFAVDIYFRLFKDKEIEREVKEMAKRW